MELPTGIGVLGDDRLALSMSQLIAERGKKVWLYPPGAQRRSRLKSKGKLTTVVPEIEQLDEHVQIVDNLEELAENCRLILFTGLTGEPEPVLRRAGDVFDGAHEICHAFHRLHGPRLTTTAALIREWTPCLQIGAMAGPLHVGELLAGMPSALVVGSPFPDLVRRVQNALDMPNLRIYTTPDLVGVELSAALVQIVALAIGIADALEAGAATHSTLMARGLAELTRLGERLGASPDTFEGLAGLARLQDAVRPGSPNHDLGALIASGLLGADLEKKASPEALSLVMIGPVRRFAQEHGIRMPITGTLDEILNGHITAKEVLEILMDQETLRGRGT